MSENDEGKTKRYLLKNQSLFSLVNKVKLWPARSGILHGVKSIEREGNRLHITTHCGEEFTVWDSRNSRSARWMRTRQFNEPCKSCGIPDWKLKKFNSTIFTDMNGRRGRS